MTTSVLSRREFAAAAALPVAAAPRDQGLAGHWPLTGDAKDHSGNGNHATNHGVNPATGEFDGRSAFLEVPHHSSLDPGAGDFTIAAWVFTRGPVMDVPGDIVSKYDPNGRRGFSLSLYSSSGGYNGQGTERYLSFGVDNARSPEWEDCGRPSPTSNYVSNSLTVFNGGLYAATTDGQTEQDWAHVYRYLGGTRWQDCGRVGRGRTRGVGPLIVHDKNLFAATWSYDWTRVSKDALDNGRVYRYRGGRDWEDCGQPGECRRLFGMASYGGALYVVADDNRCYVWDGRRRWSPCGSFRNLVHPMLVHDGRLMVGAFGGKFADGFRQAEVQAYDGQKWTPLGCPIQTPDREDQIHALQSYRGVLHATTWPTGKVGAYRNGRWEDCGRLGDSSESNALTVYNGKLYAGTIPGAEVFRYDGDRRWTRLKRFSSPEVAEDAPLATVRWGRVTSLTVFGGRLFASIGSYQSALANAPAGTRGKVFAMRAGACVCSHRDLGDGWHHVTAVRNGDRVSLSIDGKTAGTSDRFLAAGYDLSNSEPLKIGFGETDYLSGKLCDVRFYRRALSESEVRRFAKARP